MVHENGGNLTFNRLYIVIPSLLHFPTAPAGLTAALQHIAPSSRRAARYHSGILMQE
jgi:hypothetical protein